MLISEDDIKQIIQSHLEAKGHTVESITVGVEATPMGQSNSQFIPFNSDSHKFGMNLGFGGINPPKIMASAKLSN